MTERLDVQNIPKHVPLTQHALRLPGVVVPGFDTILDVSGYTIGRHVFYSVVHTGAVVGLSCCGCTNHITHLTNAKIRFVDLSSILSVESTHVRIIQYLYTL